MLNTISDGIAVAPAREFSALLPVAARSVGEDEILTVSARELHVFLEVGRDFSTWIKEKIAEYGFIEGQDYVIEEILRSPNSGSAKARPQKCIEYFLAVDVAKQICLVVNTPKGREARLYLIACEKELRALKARPRSVLDELDVLIAAKQEIVAARAREAVLQGEKLQLVAKVEEMIPAQAFCDAVRASREDLLPTVFAKEIRAALGMGVQEIIERMVQEGMLFRRGKKGKLLPKESKKYDGWFRVKKNQRWDANSGEYVPCDQTMITGYGQQQIFKKWNIPEPARLFPVVAGN